MAVGDDLVIEDWSIGTARAEPTAAAVHGASTAAVSSEAADANAADSSIAGPGAAEEARPLRGDLP
ncbi:MAG: hypothetical protein E6J91_24545 [Deltaproteobacteria bacterium]|nr:MAG: hypothetical protein E6J91_24545 [Deltaproteobacteria bacterium]